MTTIAFELTDVTHMRQGRTVLSGLSVALPKARPTCLIGASGSGKTSFLRLLNRLESPRAGRVTYDGKLLADYPVRQLRARVGFAFQAPAMFDGSVRDNLLTAARFCRGKVDADDQELAATCLELAELGDDYADREADQLSGGEKQRVALARTLMTRPDVLLLDEPTSALDPESAKRLIHTLRKLADSGMTIIMATHRHEETEWLDADYIVFDEGKIAQHHRRNDNG
jgi:ABC-type polar amino acid transport system ATPase subunit